ATTAIPRCIAALSAGATVLASLAEMMIAATCCAVCCWMKGICDAGSAAGGPMDTVSYPSSWAAFWMPAYTASKNGLPRFFGIKAIRGAWAPAATAPAKITVESTQATSSAFRQEQTIFISLLGVFGPGKLVKGV